MVKEKKMFDDKYNYIDFILNDKMRYFLKLRRLEEIDPSFRFTKKHFKNIIKIKLISCIEKDVDEKLQIKHLYNIDINIGDVKDESLVGYLKSGNFSKESKESIHEYLLSDDFSENRDRFLSSYFFYKGLRKARGFMSRFFAYEYDGTIKIKYFMAGMFAYILYKKMTNKDIDEITLDDFIFVLNNLDFEYVYSLLEDETIPIIFKETLYESFYQKRDRTEAKLEFEKMVKEFKTGWERI